MRGMRWSLIVVEARIACWPQLRSLAPHSITQATEDIPVVLVSKKMSDTFLTDENPMRAFNIISLKCCLPSTDAIDRREKIQACVWRLKVASSKRASLKSTSLPKKKKKIGYFSTDLVYIHMHYYQ